MAPEETAANVISGGKDSYVLESRPFAFGNASTLWLAQDSGGGTVCVKMFHEARVPRPRRGFMNELIARQTIGHDHVLPILDHGLEAGIQGSSPFLVLPYCRGGNLRNLMSGRDFVSPRVFLPILKQVARAVDFAHANGIIHGDIKPENILFRDETREQVWLADFGIATFFPVSEQVDTRMDPVAGTTAFMSPEQISQNRQSPASDIYSLAMVAYEALTGRLPFDTFAPPFQQMQIKVMGELLDPQVANRALAVAISEGLMAGLHVDPLKRPGSATAFYKELVGDRETAEEGRPQKGQADDVKFSQKDFLRLYYILSKRFNESELRSLVFEIGGVAYDDLPGETIRDKARELITYLFRRRRVMDLVKTGQKVRPDIEWI